MSVKLNNPLFEKLGMKYPIIQGGMAWAGTGHLAGAVSEAGGLGQVIGRLTRCVKKFVVLVR